MVLQTEPGHDKENGKSAGITGEERKIDTVKKGYEQFMKYRNIRTHVSVNPWVRRCSMAKAMRHITMQITHEQQYEAS
jgi:hypothetical protein